MSKFKYPVSMVVTKEQFEADLRKPLEELGYDFSQYMYLSTTLCTNMDNRDDMVSHLSPSLRFDHKRFYIEGYRPDLFIALASQKEGDTPNVGEYVVIPNKDGEWASILSKNYISHSDYNGEPVKIVKIKDEDIYTALAVEYKGKLYGHDLANTRKASKEELVEFFTTKNKEGMHSDHKGEIIGYKLIKSEYEKQAANIAFEKSDRLHDYFNDITGGFHITPTSRAAKNLKEAGILDLWFEPVYKEQDRFLTVSCDQGNFDVKLVPNGFEFEGKVVPLDVIKNLVAKMNNEIPIQGWNVGFSEVNIGCKTGISIMELQKLIDQHGK